MPTSTELTPVYNILGLKLRMEKGVHHLYYGLALLALALYGGIKWDLPLLVWGLYGIGVYLTLDDLYQHHRQVRDPYYRSPVHNLVHYLDKLGPWTRRLEAWANKLFGA